MIRVTRRFSWLIPSPKSAVCCHHVSYIAAVESCAARRAAESAARRQNYANCLGQADRAPRPAAADSQDHQTGAGPAPRLSGRATASSRTGTDLLSLSGSDKDQGRNPAQRRGVQLGAVAADHARFFQRALAPVSGATGSGPPARPSSVTVGRPLFSSAAEFFDPASSRRRFLPISSRSAANSEHILSLSSIFSRHQQLSREFRIPTPP